MPTVNTRRELARRPAASSAGAQPTSSKRRRSSGCRCIVWYIAESVVGAVTAAGRVPSRPIALPPRADGGILPEAVRGLVTEERVLLGRLRELLVTETAAGDDVRQLRQAELDLDELFLLVVVGEFNAGKSAFINALIGERVLREGVTPTTAVITRLRYAASLVERREGAMLEVGYPLELLRDVAIVDTPGTNAILREHEEITSHFVPRADLVLFVTSADRPFTETERAFMQRIREWGKKVVVVLNKVDLLSEDQVDEQVGFVRDGVERLLGFRPAVFPVSARSALLSRAATDEAERNAARA